LTEGEAEAASLDYAPLPADMASSVRAKLKTVDLTATK